LRHLGFKNDHEIIAAESIAYDALYGYCQEIGPPWESRRAVPLIGNGKESLPHEGTSHA
jgi:hypothetical protein